MASRRGLALGAATAVVLVTVALVWTVLDESGGARGEGGDVIVPLSLVTDEPVALPDVAPSEVLPLESGGPGTLLARGGSAGAADDGGAPDEVPAVRFSGRVVDEDGAPVDGATVLHYPAPRTRKMLGLEPGTQFESIDWSLFPSTTTDASGRFSLPARELPAPPDGERPDQGGYVSPPNLLPQLVVTHPDFAARPWLCEGYTDSDYDAGDIVLRTGATMVGRVVDHDGLPLAGVEFAMSIFDGPWEVKDYGSWHTIRSALGGTSGPDGRFALRGLWASQALFTTRLDGYAPVEVKAKALLPGEVRDVGEVVLSRGRVITGHVVDPDGAPIEGAGVLARTAQFRYGPPDGDTVLMEFKMFLRSNGMEDTRVTTDADGAFAFTGLTLPHYSIFAWAEGREAAVQRDVDVGGSEVLLVLPRQASIVVTVKDARTGKRVRGVSATARRMADKKVTQMEPSLDVLTGREVLDALEDEDADVAGGADGLLLVQGAGTYRTHLIVSAPGYATNGFVLEGVVPPQRARRTVQLVAESSVSGQVTGAQGKPLPEAHVTLLPPTDLRVKLAGREAQSDGQGRFRFGELRAGDWTLQAEAEGYMPSQERTIVVAPQTARVGEDVQLRAGAILSGTVLGPDGAPAGRISVGIRLLSDPVVTKDGVTQVFTANGPQGYVAPGNQRSDQEGRFTFDGLRPGRYELKADPGAVVTVVAPAGETTEVQLQLRRRPVVRGRVTDGGVPVQGALVSEWTTVPWSGWDLDDESSVETDAFGEYTLELWKPGTSQIAARHDGAITPPREVTTDWGLTETVDLAFAHGHVAGRVTEFDTGEPIEGARVSLVLQERQPDGTWEAARPTVSVYAEATGADGRFEVGRMVPGSYQVGVSATGYLLGGGEGDTGVEVPAEGGPDDLAYALSRGGTIRGRVLTADASPLPGKLRVRVDRATGGMVTSADVQPGGSYEAVGVPTGDFVLRVLSATMVLGGTTPDAYTEAPVSAVAGQAVSKDLVIEPAP